MEDVYNFNDLPRLDTKDDPVEYRKFYDQSSGFTAQNAPVQNHFTFRVSDINSYWLLHRAYLLVEFKLTAGATATERATLANGVGHIFDRCIMRLGDTIIEDKPRHFYRDYELDTMTWHKQYAETIGSLQMYHPRNLSGADFSIINHNRAVYHQPGGTTETTTPDAFDVSSTPEGKNRTLTQSNPTYCMIPLIHIFNFPKVYEKVIRGLDIELEFYTASDTIKLIRSGIKSDGTAASAGTVVADNYKFEWQGAGISLYLPRIEPTPRVKAELNQMLIKGVSPMVEFEKSLVYREAIPAGRADGDWSIATNTSTPTRIYFMLRTQQSETSQRKNLYERDNLLQRIDVFVNGERVPTENLQAEGVAGSSILQRNFTQYLRQFHNLQGNMDGVYSGASGGSHMSMLDFELNNVIAVDLKQLGRDLVDKSSDIRITYQLDASAASPHWLYAIVFSKSTVVLEMSESRSVALVK